MPNTPRESAKWQRYEVKYLISEAQAAEVHRWCQDHLPPDPHSSTQAGYQYPVLSTYLDSPTRELLLHTLNGLVNRYKLRARTYRSFHEPPDGLPTYFEIKRRLDGIVQKTRAKVAPQLTDQLLWNTTVLFDEQTECDATTRTNMNEFLQLRGRISANPVLGVFYLREAYEGISADRIRITLDRQLHYGLLQPPGNGQRDTWWPVDPGGVVLEVKFTNTYPFWVADMLHRTDVLRRGVCKYVVCSRAAGTAVPETWG
jgi:hypothetical protein